jgi:demethylmenaquinone methyltransferase/2-methoxy-6-polyprenyl-1,4-benzoquinol methylase
MFTTDAPAIREILEQRFSGRDILEVACGTGHWTLEIAGIARSVFATDVNQEMVDLAQEKVQGKGNVRVEVADAYELGEVEGRFSGCFMGYFWSHVPCELASQLLARVREHLEPGSPLLMIDNRMVPAWEGRLTPKDEHGNTFFIRELPDGDELRLIKNFPTADELEAVLSPYAGEISFSEFEYTWCVRCNMR